MNTEKEENYEEILQRLIQLYPLFENALQGGELCDEVRNFMLEDLNINYSSLQDLREEIDHISIPKKRFASKNTIF